MAMPRTITTITSDGITFESSVDKAMYTLTELSRAAQRDVGKFVVKKARGKARKRTGRGRQAIQYWNRKEDLQIGIKPKGFYMGFFELGLAGMPKDAMIQSSVEENIDAIRLIQAQYLSAIEDTLLAAALINESEEVGGDD